MVWTNSRSEANPFDLDPLNKPVGYTLRRHQRVYLLQGVSERAGLDFNLARPLKSDVLAWVHFGNLKLILIHSSSWRHALYCTVN